MANLTFSNLVSEVMAHLGLDSTDSTNQTNVYRWINYVHSVYSALINTAPARPYGRANGQYRSTRYNQIACVGKQVILG